jgi:tetratricopeptide (TPR) repeat protein
MGPRHDRRGVSLRVLARALDGAGRTEEALAPIAEALAIHRERLGPSHLQVAIDLACQATIESHSSRLAEAERDGRQVLALLTGGPAVVASDLATLRLNVGRVLAEAGRLEEADEQLAQAVAGFRGQQPQQAQPLGYALDALGDVARRRGQTRRASDLGREALATLERSGGGRLPATDLTRVRAGAALWAAGEAAEGERLLRAGLEGLRRTFPGHADVATAAYLLGEALQRSGRVAEATPLMKEALAWRLAHLGPADPRTVAVRRALAASSQAASPPLVSAFPGFIRNPG